MEHGNECTCEKCMGTDRHKKSCKNKKMSCGGSFGITYGLAFLGAAIYYIQQATGFWMGVVGVLKALVWPAMIIHKLLEFIGA